MDVYDKVYRYYLAANYLTIAQMYLRDNILLSEPLKQEHLKKHPSGHWGASPGINMIIASILGSLASNESSDEFGIVLGTGHASACLLAHMYLNGSLKSVYPQYAYGYNGMATLCRSYCATKGFPGEICSKIPGCIYDGGELGYALCISYGAVLHNPNKTIFTILGDGECETSVTMASWVCQRLLSDQTCGAVIPIINLNQYRMGAKSVLADMSLEEIRCFFSSHCFDAILVHTWQELPHTIKAAVESVMQAKTDVSKRGMTPVILYTTLKGEDGPSYGSANSFQRALSSHKLPIRNPSENYKDFEAFQNWLSSYSPMDLFTPDGCPQSDILELTKATIFDLHRSACCLELPCLYSGPSNITISNAISDYLHSILAINPQKLHIFSPDELSSNGYDSLLTSANHTSCGATEILNEHICLGLCQGYLLTGRRGIVISYESFMPIVTSMVSQYAKFLYTSVFHSWRQKYPTLLIILTSVCWTNTYSHQNPEFVSGLFTKEYPFIRAFYPIDISTSLTVVKYSLCSTGEIHVVTYDKRGKQRYLNCLEAETAINQGYYFWDKFSTYRSADIVLISTGDIINEQCLSLLKRFERYDIRICYISVLELSILNCHDDSLTTELDRIWSGSVPVIYAYHGYSSTIKSLLFPRQVNCSIDILGYRNNSWMSASSIYKMIVNEISSWDIGIHICNTLLQQCSRLDATLLLSIKQELMQERDQYIIEQDMN